MNPNCSYIAVVLFPQLTPKVKRVLGQNPGPFTLQGTNTYLLSGQASRQLLVDTAEGADTYIDLLRDAARDSSSKADVTDIVLTHWHHDHVDGLAAVLNLLSSLDSTPPRIHKYPAPDHDHLVVDVLESMSGNMFTRAANGKVLHDLQDDQVLDLGDDCSVRVLHAPGHTTDSIALIYKPASSREVLLTADTVLGMGTAVFEDLHTYLNTLQRLVDALTGKDEVELYPGHGDVVAKGRDRIRGYIAHRLEREAQVMDALRKGPANVEE